MKKTEKSEIKWRGIRSTELKINENEPVTTLNRYKQKTISLPRISDDKRWAGYPGITGVSRKIARIIEDKVKKPQKYYVEPFAGTAKVYQALNKSKGLFYKYILNDKSDFVYKWLKGELACDFTVITNEDFGLCMLKYDTEETVFVIDHPWNKSYYNQSFSCFDRNNVKEYNEQVLEICRKLKGKFIITTRRENKLMYQSEFNHKEITSEYPVSGRYPKILLTSNIDI